MDGISQEVPTEAAEIAVGLAEPLDGLIKSVTSSSLGIVYVHLRRPLGRIRIAGYVKRPSKNTRYHAYRYTVWLDGVGPRGMHITLGGKVAHHYGPEDVGALVEDVYKHARHMLYGGPRERPTPLRRERPEPPQSEVVLRP